MRRGRYIIAALLTVAGIARLGAQQPTGTIRGRVTDGATQQPVSGVTVTVAGRSTRTPADGRYLITGVAVGAYTLGARLIGYASATRSVTVAGGDTVVVDLALTRQALGLSEVVVVGYGERRAGELSSAVAQVNAGSFNTGTITSPQQLIENKVAGVQVIDNNEPGGGLSVRIRGQASINARFEPLYVLDGVPLGTGSGGGLSAGRDPLNFINPSDIASMTVLKDAAAAAIYGANASNGVVLITSKSGQGRPGVEYSGSVSGAWVTRLPAMLNAAQFTSAVQTYAPQNAALLSNANTDWFSLVDRTAVGQSHNFALSGVGATNSYRLSLGYANQDGILQGSSAQRISLFANYDQQLYDGRLDLRAIVRGARTLDQYTPVGVLYNAVQMGPTQPVYDATSATGYANWPGNQLTSADNPVEVLNLSKDHGTTYRSIGTLQAKYDFSAIRPLQGLTGTLDLGYDVTDVNRVTFYPNNIHLQTKNGTNGSFFRNTPTQLNTVLEGYLNYRPPANVGPGNLDVTGGYSYSQSRTEFASVSARQLTSNLLADNGIPQTAVPPVPDETIVESKLISFIGRADYNIEDRYLASVSIRRDGVSRFGPGHQWGNFPAASIGWRLSREPFLRGIPAISDLKLRASWGKTGNSTIPEYLYFSTFQGCNPRALVQFGNQFICPFRPSAVDPNIKWESTTSYDVGLDYGISNQRFTGSIDWYTKRTEDLLFTVPAPGGANLSNFVTTNIGTMKNTGVELALSARLLDGSQGGLSWTADFNVAHNVNELVSVNPNASASTKIQVGAVSGGVGTTIEVLQPGQPINSFFVCRQAYSPTAGILEGKYLSLVGDTVITGCNTPNRRAFHDPSPHWVLGFTSSMSYHRFDASFTLRAWLGNYVYNNVASNLGTYQELTRGAPYNLNTSVLDTHFLTPQYLSDYYVEKASFLRLDNVRVSYTFPWQGQQLLLFAGVQNAFTITGYNGVDPTAGTGGIDNNIYPRSRIFTGGLNVQF